MIDSGPVGDHLRVVQIHPSLRCNLTCLHCYSSSSPHGHPVLPQHKMQDFITSVRQEGYNVMSISGGEPLMLPYLADILQFARQHGMATSMTTNGILLTRRRIDILAPLLDTIAISLDGVPESHNRVRGLPDAFDRMARNLPYLQQSGTAFGFIFTLTLHNLHELEEVAEIAVSQGAALLQIHPLEEVGRAQIEMQRAAPDELEMAYGFLEVARLQERYRDRLEFQYDVVDREQIVMNPSRVFVFTSERGESVHRPLSHLISPLVLEADGTIVPIQYGFSHRFTVGNLMEDNLTEQFQKWKSEVYPDFLHLCRDVFNRLIDSNLENLPFSNWYERITTQSHDVVVQTGNNT